MRIYDDYLDEVDRVSAIQEAKNELEMTRLNFMLEMVERKYEINCKHAELKVLTEGGTYEDLQYLYEAAAKEKDGEKQGIITTIINAIISVINSITTAISNFFNGNKKAKKDPNKIIKVPKEEADESSFICSKFNSMKATISDMSTTKKVLALGGMATAVAGTYVIGKKTKNGVKQYKEMKQKEVDEQISTLNAALGFFKDKLASIPNSVRSLFGADKKEKTDDNKEDKTGNEPQQDGENNTTDDSGKTEDNGGTTPKQKDTNESNGDKKEAKGGFIEQVQKPVKGLIAIIQKILAVFGVGVTPDDEKEEIEPSEPTNDGGKTPEPKEENNDDGGGSSGTDDKSGKKDETPDSNQDKNDGTKTESVDDDFWNDVDLFSENFEEDYFDESVDDYEDMDFDHILDSI